MTKHNDKDDIASGDAERETSTRQLSDFELEERRWKKSILSITTIFSGLLTLTLFAMIICTGIRFYETYSYHLVSDADKAGPFLTSFLVLLSPTFLLSTLFIITFITTLRFISGFAATDELSPKVLGEQDQGLLERLVGLLERKLNSE